MGVNTQQPETPMKLHEIINFERALAESKMAEKHQALQDAIADEFNLKDGDPMIQKIVGYLHNEDDAKVDAFLYDHFEDEMPYGTKKARDGDPSNWIADHMSGLFHKYL